MENPSSTDNNEEQMEVTDVTPPVSLSSPFFKKEYEIFKQH